MRQFLATESSLKMIKNAFYFTLNVLVVFKTFNFLSWLFGQLISKTSQPKKQTIVTLPNISKSKRNQTTKFDQTTKLIDYNIKIFLVNNQNVADKLFPDPFIKSQDWAYLWVNSLKFHAVCFYCMPSWGLSNYIETKLQATFFYVIQSFFKKQKEVWN